MRVHFISLRRLLLLPLGRQWLTNAKANVDIYMHHMLPVSIWLFHNTSSYERGFTGSHCIYLVWSISGSSNLLPWSGGHGFEPQSGWTWGFLMPKSDLNQNNSIRPSWCNYFSASVVFTLYFCHIYYHILATFFGEHHTLAVNQA